nr:potassium transporter 7-like isoform X1 [Ipomoea batatas]
MLLMLHSFKDVADWRMNLCVDAGIMVDCPMFLVDVYLQTTWRKAFSVTNCAILGRGSGELLGDLLFKVACETSGKSSSLRVWTLRMKNESCCVDAAYGARSMFWWRYFLQTNNSYASASLLLWEEGIFSEQLGILGRGSVGIVWSDLLFKVLGGRSDNEVLAALYMVAVLIVSILKFLLHTVYGSLLIVSIIKDNAEQLLIRTSPQIGSDSVDSTLGRRIILIIQTLGAASGDVGTAEYIHIKQADKDCVLSGIRKMLRRIGASR